MIKMKLKWIGILTILTLVGLTSIIVWHFGDITSLVAALGIIFCVLAEQKIAFANAQGRLREEIHDDRLRLNLVMSFLAVGVVAIPQLLLISTDPSLSTTEASGSFVLAVALAKVVVVISIVAAILILTKQTCLDNTSLGKEGDDVLQY